MGKLVSQIFVSLDGVYQAPGGPQEDPRDGFEQGGGDTADIPPVAGREQR